MPLFNVVSYETDDQVGDIVVEVESEEGRTLCTFFGPDAIVLAAKFKYAVSNEDSKCNQNLTSSLSLG